jgi:hypothetical protein
LIQGYLTGCGSVLKPSFCRSRAIDTKHIFLEECK